MEGEEEREGDKKEMERRRGEYMKECYVPRMVGRVTWQSRTHPAVTRQLAGTVTEPENQYTVDCHGSDVHLLSID